MRPRGPNYFNNYAKCKMPILISIIAAPKKKILMRASNKLSLLHDNTIYSLDQGKSQCQISWKCSIYMLGLQCFLRRSEANKTSLSLIMMGINPSLIHFNAHGTYILGVINTCTATPKANFQISIILENSHDMTLSNFRNRCFFKWNQIISHFRVGSEE